MPKKPYKQYSGDFIVDKSETRGIISITCITFTTRRLYMKQDFPEGKFLSAVKIGAKGQIVIPKEVRDMFGFKPGDSVLLMADKTQGVALQPFSFAEVFWQAARNVMKEDDKK